MKILKHLKRIFITGVVPMYVYWLAIITGIIMGVSK